MLQKVKLISNDLFSSDKYFYYDDEKISFTQACELYSKEESKTMKNDNVNHPAHYTAGGIECIEALKAATTGLEGIEAVCTANAIKYLWRWKYKNGIEDLKKAKWYINYLIDNGSKEKLDKDK